MFFWHATSLPSPVVEAVVVVAVAVAVAVAAIRMADVDRVGCERTPVVSRLYLAEILRTQKMTAALRGNT